MQCFTEIQSAIYVSYWCRLINTVLGREVAWNRDDRYDRWPIKALLMSVTWLDVTIVIQLKFIYSIELVSFTNDQTIIGLPSLLVVVYTVTWCIFCRTNSKTVESVLYWLTILYDRCGAPTTAVKNITVIMSYIMLLI